MTSAAWKPFFLDLYSWQGVVEGPEIFSALLHHWTVEYRLLGAQTFELFCDFRMDDREVEPTFGIKANHDSVITLADWAIINDVSLELARLATPVQIRWHSLSKEENRRQLEAVEVAVPIGTKTIHIVHTSDLSIPESSVIPVHLDPQRVNILNNPPAPTPSGQGKKKRSKKKKA